MCSMSCEACVTREECERRHKELREDKKDQDEKIANHGELLARVTTILERMPETHPPAKKSFWETSSGKVVIYGAVGLVLVVVSYALGAKNVEQILNALPK